MSDETKTIIVLALVLAALACLGTLVLIYAPSGALVEP